MLSARCFQKLTVDISIFLESVPPFIHTMMMNGGNTTMVQPIRVRIPQIFSSPLPLRRTNPDLRCNGFSDDCSDQLMVQNYRNFKRSGSPSRIMFYDEGTWVDFSHEVLESLRSGFRKAVIELSIDGEEYAVDFLRMLQINLVSGSQRSIAWIDENDKCFFPEVFVEEEFEEEESEDSESIGIDIEIQITIGKRRRESPDMGGRDVEATSLINRGDRQENGVDCTKRQRFTSQVYEVSKWPNAKLMTEKTNPSFLAVSNKFLSAITKVDGGATITAIHECAHSGPVEKARLEVFQMQSEITKTTRGSSNTVYAWFAASAGTVTGILTHGFGFPCITSGSPAYGIGVYLSPVGLPQLSAMKTEADNNGEKHIIVCRVILGNVEKVEAGSEQRGPSSPDFDTGADDPENPKWYVVWDTKISTHILPEYVVSYKPSAQVTAEAGAANSTKFSLPKIISKMEPRLSSSQLQQVLTAHDNFKARKMSKEKFIQQLRAFAGDQVIMSVIREIQCSG